MKPVDVKNNTYVDFGEESSNKDSNLKLVFMLELKKNKNIFAKGYAPDWSGEIFVIKKIKNRVPWKYVGNNLKGKEIAGKFYEKELQKANQEKLRIEKVIKRKANRLYVKWKGYDNSFNSWIDKKDIIK